MKTGILSTCEKSMMDVPMPSATEFRALGGNDALGD
jgi:hypothetical protein